MTMPIGGFHSAGDPDVLTRMLGRLRTSFMIQGGFAIVAGLLFLVWPTESATAFVLVFAVWLLASAILSAIFSVVRKQGSLLGTLVPAALGILLLFIPRPRARRSSSSQPSRPCWWADWPSHCR